MKIETEEHLIPEKFYPARLDNIKWFVAEDGKKFRIEKDCVNYEKELLMKKVRGSFKTIHINLPNYIVEDSFENWSKIENEDQLLFTKHECGMMQKYDYVHLNDGEDNRTELKIGDWYSYMYSDGGDYRGSYYVYTLEYFKEYLKTILLEIENQEVTNNNL